MSEQKIAITDHCIVRYFERHFGIDIEDIKREILPDHIRQKITEFTESYVIDDIEFRIRNNCIITCIPTAADEPLRKAKNKPTRHESNKKRKKEVWQVNKKYNKKNKKGGYK